MRLSTNFRDFAYDKAKTVIFNVGINWEIMAGRSAKIGITCIVFGILWIPIWIIIGNLIVEPLTEAITGSPNMPGEIALGMLCVPGPLLLIIGLVKFLMDDD